MGTNVAQRSNASNGVTMASMMNEYLDLAGDIVNAFVRQGTGFTAQRIEQYASIGDEIVKTLRDNGETQAADLAASLENRVREAATYLRECDGRRLWSDVQDTLNGRGWLAATAGVAAGFIVSRAIRSSPRGRYA
ncbi:MAG: hypothetical protein JO192_09030 [Candidatus Eremiobacteraeota bacterium]|nr:hypothetical protein [Candidatus Eremiobacteraeota bacterium]